MNNNTNNFKESVLKYEESVFNEYISKRSKLIENIKNLQLNNLNNNQLLNFTSDLKIIIDPIKTCISNIDDHFLNNCLDNNKSIHDLSDLNNLMGLYVLFDFLGRGGGGSSSGSEFESETSLDSDSE
jgi:hypothetical protein